MKSALNSVFCTRQHHRKTSTASDQLGSRNKELKLRRQAEIETETSELTKSAKGDETLSM